MVISREAATRPSAAQAIAGTLREEILSLHEEGVFLGSEEELLPRLGVSRPTLRQAARILEHENLLVVRRGASGGFFSRVPTADAVSHVASVYLRYRATTLNDLNRAAALVVPEIARLAAMHPSPEARVALAELADNPEHEALIGTPTFVRDVVQEFGLHLVALIHHPPLALFYEMLLELAVSPFEGRVLDDPSRAREVLAFHHDLGDAVCRGEPAGAGDIASRYFVSVEGWLRSDGPEPAEGTRGS